MKISNLWRNFDFGSFLLVLLVVGVIGGMGTAVGISIYRQEKLKSAFPVGSSVQLKGLNIKGNVVEFNDTRVTILVTDNEGKTHNLTTDANLLTK